MVGGWYRQTRGLKRGRRTAACGLGAALLAAPLPAFAAGLDGDPIAPVILGMTAILAFALLGRYLARRLGQPSVMGELIMGIVLGNAFYFFGLDFIAVLREGTAVFDIVERALAGMSWEQAAAEVLPPEKAAEILAIIQGPHGADILHVAQAVDLFSRYGVIFMLFLVGLETSLRELKEVGADSVRVAVIGVVAPFALGFAAAWLLLPEKDLNTDLFIAAALCATSVGITARVLRDLGQHRSGEARIILGAAVMDDVLGLIILTIVSGIVVTGSLDLGSMGWTVVKALLFLGGALVLGPWFLRQVIRALHHMSLLEAKLFVSFIFVMLLAWLANLAGLATIIGAFAAGVILHDGFFRRWQETEHRGERHFSIQELVAPLEAVLAPVFFVLMGIQVKLETFLDWQVIGLAVGLLVAAVLGKLAAGWGVRGEAKRWVVGFGMMPRGEVGLIFASIGKGLGVIDDALFASVVLLVIVTTLLTPPALTRCYASRSAS